MQRFKFNQQMARFRLHDDQELLNCELTGATHITQANKVRLLQACSEFDTLDGHATTVTQRLGFGPMHLSAVRAQLQEAANNGLLISRDFLLDVIHKSKSGTQSDTKITQLGVLTKNRPEPLKECLQSYGECITRSKRPMKFVIADQSDSSRQAANLELLHSIKTKFGMEIVHLDWPAVDKLCTELSKACALDPTLVRYGLRGDCGVDAFAGGANRNLLLLSSVDELSVQADDDSVCAGIKPPELESGIALTSLMDPAEFWFPNEGELQNWPDQLEELDLFACHEVCLGKTISQCVIEHDNEVLLDYAGQNFFRKLRIADSNVAITNPGLLGESGRAEGQPILLIDGPRRERLVQSEQHYRYVQRTHQVMRGVTRPTITEGAICYGFNLGMDNRHTFPPFMPVLRGEDALLTALFRATMFSSFFAMLPWLVYHKGAGQKKRSEFIETQRTVKLTFSDVLSLIVQTYQARMFPHDDDSRMRGVGKLLIEVASMPDSNYSHVLRLLWWQSATSQLNQLEQALKKHSRLPKFWSEDIENYMNESMKILQNPQAVIAGDVVRIFGEDAGFAKQKEWIRMMGQLIYAWPDLRVAARDLKERNGALGTRI